MSQQLQSFLKASSEAVKDTTLRERLKSTMDIYTAAVEKGKSQFYDLNAAKRIAKNRKWYALENLERHLLEFETNFKSRGGRVIWAEDAEHAFEEIHHILKRNHTRSIVKSKSMVTEEIDLNRKLEGNGIEVIETDLGEYIVQLAGEKPFHIVTPAIHKSKEDVATLFAEKLGTEKNISPSALSLTAREKIRPEYRKADAGITGANFLIADTGSVCITENEGNARMTAAWPKTLISVVGIEKVLASLDDLSLFWPLLSAHGTGQTLTTYNNLLSGPKQDSESDGPEEMYVILLDNGRSDILSQPKKREALYCIKCGACLNSCPVYKTIGGHAYGSTYTGPIGSVISPTLEKDMSHLSQVSSMCGKCSEVCPVNIPIHDLILQNRTEAPYDAGGMDNIAWKSWELAVMNRKMMNQSSRAKNIMLKSFFKKSWGEKRTLPKFQTSFNQQWKAKYE